MRIMRSQQQWQVIIEEQQASGLSINDYCQLHQLSTTSFYACRKKLSLSSSQFIRAKITQQVELVQGTSVITLTIGQAHVALPRTTSASYLSLIHISEPTRPY